MSTYTRDGPRNSVMILCPLHAKWDATSDDEIGSIENPSSLARRSSYEIVAQQLHVRN